MIAIENTLISDDIAKVQFCCDLTKCFGACCIEGDAGAPLDEDEISVLEDNLEKIKPFLTNDGLEVIENCGVFDYDIDGNFVTPLINNKNCAFLYFENKIAKCAIEKAFIEKKIKFQKPISCHLYPIRITKYEDYDAVNYHKWTICEDACKNGQRQKILLYKFLKIPLIRKYGRHWFKKLEKHINEIKIY